MFWNVVLLLFMWSVGLVLGAFGLTQIMLCIFASFPVINRLAKVNAINKRPAIISNLVSILLWVILFSAAMFLLFRFGNDYAKTGMLIGLGISFLKGIPQLSPNNPNNIVDFLQSHTRYITDHSLKLAIVDNDPDIIIRVYGIV